MPNRSEGINLNIRKASPEDIPTILRLIKELSVFEKMEKEVFNSEELLRENLFGNKQYAEALIAEVDRIPIGYVIYFFNYSTFLGHPGFYLEDMYVSPEYRGHGIGKKLLKYCAKIAKEHKCKRMEWIVLNWNPARKFYEQLGAKAMDEWVLYRLPGEALDKMAE